MRARSTVTSRTVLAGLVAAVLLVGLGPAAVAQQARPATPAAAAPVQPPRPPTATAASCFSATESAAIVAGCDAVLANRAAHTADQIGVALQRRGAARAGLGQVIEAIADFRQMVQANYKPHEAHASIGSLHVREGRLAEAETSYREALRLNPSYGLAHNGIGHTLIALGRAAEAVGHFNQAIATADNDANAHFGKGLALFETRDLDGSIRSLGDALRLNPRQLLALSQRAQAHADKGDLPSALKDADAAVAIAEGDERVRVLTQRGRLRSAAKANDGAITDCIEATALADRINTRDVQARAAAHGCLAFAHQNRGALVEAEQSFDRALQWAGEDASAFAGRGYVRLQRGRFDEAVADFTASLKINPRSQDSLRFLGLAYADKGDAPKALETFARAIAADAKDPWPLMLRGITYAKIGDRARALRDVEDAFRLTGQQSSDAHLVRGAVHNYVQDFAAARTDFDNAIRLNPDNAQAFRLLGRLNTRTGRLDEAGRALETAGRLLPDDAGVIMNRGLLAYARRDYATAVSEITKSLAINAAHAEGFAVRGQAHEALGRQDLAIADYRTAETKLATDTDGRQALAQARERLAALTRVPSVTPREDRPAVPTPPNTTAGRPPAETTDAPRPSTYCRVVEGLFVHSRKYTGVNFDLGCGTG